MSDKLSYADDYSLKIQSSSISSSNSETTKENQQKPVDLVKKGIIFPRKFRYTIFFIILITNLIINMDHGTIPASTAEIKKDLEIGDGALGVFGSLVYLGNILGALIFMGMMRNINRKYLIILSLIMIVLLLCMFAIVSNIYVLYLNRTLTGIFQSFMAIYFPVWSDQYGPQQRKSAMIAVLQLCVPLGIVMGYILTAIIKNYLPWNYSLYVQSCLSGIMMLTFVWIPSIYFSPTLHNNRRISMEKSENDEKKSSDIQSVYGHIDQNNEEKKTFISDLKTLCKNFIFLCCALTLAIIFYIITAVQFWAPDYLKEVLKSDENLVSIAFTFCCISAPTTGVILGGYSLSKVGGPNKLKSILICLVYSIGAFLCSLPIPLADDIFSFTGLFWFCLFFGGAMVPMLTGIIISSVPPETRSSGNSLSILMSNLLGYLPSPFVYGFISTKTFNTHPRLAMLVTMNISSLGVVFMVLAVYFKCKQKKESNYLPRKSRAKSELNQQASLIANLWVNNNLGEDQIGEEEENKENEEKTVPILDSPSFLLIGNSETNNMKKELLNKKEAVN